MGTLETSTFDVVGINRKSTFTLDEARIVFPIVYRLTKRYSERVHGLIAKIENLSQTQNLGAHNSSLADSLEAEAGRLIVEWQEKIQKLGGLPNGHWVVDFDSGDGYFCWKYPEPAIDFWHHYRDGFSKRIKLSALQPVQETATYNVEKSL